MPLAPPLKLYIYRYLNRRPCGARDEFFLAATA
jgi:hypothetical protein